MNERIEALADRSIYETDTARTEELERAPDTASLFCKCVVARPNLMGRVVWTLYDNHEKSEKAMIVEGG